MLASEYVSELCIPMKYVVIPILHPTIYSSLSAVSSTIALAFKRSAARY